MRNDFIVELQHEFTRVCRNFTGEDERSMSQLAEALIDSMLKNHGGQSVYLSSVNRVGRNAKIIEEAKTGNKKAIMKKYSLSKSQFYAILRG